MTDINDRIYELSRMAQIHRDLLFDSESAYRQLYGEICPAIAAQMGNLRTQIDSLSSCELPTHQRQFRDLFRSLRDRIDWLSGKEPHEIRDRVLELGTSVANFQRGLSEVESHVKLSIQGFRGEHSRMSHAIDSLDEQVHARVDRDHHLTEHLMTQSDAFDAADRLALASLAGLVSSTEEDVGAALRKLSNDVQNASSQRVSSFQSVRVKLGDLTDGSRSVASAFPQMTLMIESLKQTLVGAVNAITETVDNTTSGVASSREALNSGINKLCDDSASLFRSLRTELSSRIEAIRNGYRKSTGDFERFLSEESDIRTRNYDEIQAKLSGFSGIIDKEAKIQRRAIDKISNLMKSAGIDSFEMLLVSFTSQTRVLLRSDTLLDECDKRLSDIETSISVFDQDLQGVVEKIQASQSRLQARADDLADQVMQGLESVESYITQLEQLRAARTKGEIPPETLQVMARYFDVIAHKRIDKRMVRSAHLRQIASMLISEEEEALDEYSGPESTRTETSTWSYLLTERVFGDDSMTDEAASQRQADQAPIESAVKPKEKPLQRPRARGNQTIGSTTEKVETGNENSKSAPNRT